jgi:hypothetical protein
VSDLVVTYHAARLEVVEAPERILVALEVLVTLDSSVASVSCGTLTLCCGSGGVVAYEIDGWDTAAAALTARKTCDTRPAGRR